MKQQAIKNNGTGHAYVTHYGKRLPLHLFERTYCDYVTYKGKSLKVTGWYPIGHYGAYGIHVSECGEKAIVFYKQNF